MITPGQLRIGDAERSRAIDALRAHAEAGRLTPTELTERTQMVAATRTQADLEPIFEDLPGGQEPDQTWNVLPQPAPGQPLFPHQEVSTVAAPVPVPRPSSRHGWGDDPEDDGPWSFLMLSPFIAFVTMFMAGMSWPITIGVFLFTLFALAPLATALNRRHHRRHP